MMSSQKKFILIFYGYWIQNNTLILKELLLRGVRGKIKFDSLFMSHNIYERVYHKNYFHYYKFYHVFLEIYKKLQNIPFF